MYLHAVDVRGVGDEDLVEVHHADELESVLVPRVRDQIDKPALTSKCPTKQLSTK